MPVTHLLTLATTASPGRGGGLPAWLLLAGAVLVWVIAYLISIRLHPFKACQECGVTGRQRGAIFTNSFRSCRRCGGTGRQLRLFAKDPSRP